MGISFSVGLGICMVGPVVYFAWEQAPFHASIVHEQLYALFWNLIVVYVCVYTGDSPFRAFLISKNVGWTDDIIAAGIAIFSVVVASFLVGRSLNAEMTKSFINTHPKWKNRMTDSSGISSWTKTTSDLEAEAKSQHIASLANELQYYSLGARAYARWTGKAQKQRNTLHQLIASLTPQELRFVLNSINVPVLLLCGTNQTAELLSIRHIDKMDITSRAIMIDAFQKTGMRFDETRQNCVEFILSSTNGYDLTKLKNMIDDGGDYHNLHKLIYTDISDLKRRERILSHFEEQAMLVLDTDGDGKVTDQERMNRRPKVLSDVDDTLYSSGGMFPAGLDQRFPRHTVYPGVLAFFRELDRIPPCARSDENGIDRPTSDDVTISMRLPSGEDVDITLNRSTSLGQVQQLLHATKGVPPHLQKLTVKEHNETHMGTKDPHKSSHSSLCNLVFLSARPHAYKDYAESASFRKFSALVQSGRMHTMPTLLPGGLREGAGAVVSALLGMGGIWNGVGHKKFQTFQEYSKLYPEYSYVFVGDNGQGDVLAGELMLQRNPSCKAVFIHRVQPLNKTLSMFDIPSTTVAQARSYNKSNSLALHSIYQNRNRITARSSSPISYLDADLEVSSDPLSDQSPDEMKQDVSLRRRESMNKVIEEKELFQAADMVKRPDDEQSILEPKESQLPIAISHVNSIDEMKECEECMVARWAEEGVYIFDTYIGAAVIAFQLKLISMDSMLSIVCETINDFNTLRIQFHTSSRGGKLGPFELDKLIDLYNRDLASANLLLHVDDRIPSIEAIASMKIWERKVSESNKKLQEAIEAIAKDAKEKEEEHIRRSVALSIASLDAAQAFSGHSEDKESVLARQVPDKSELEPGLEKENEASSSNLNQTITTSLSPTCGNPDNELHSDELKKNGTEDVTVEP